MAHEFWTTRCKCSPLYNFEDSEKIPRSPQQEWILLRLRVCNLKLKFPLRHNQDKTFWAWFTSHKEAKDSCRITFGLRAHLTWFLSLPITISITFAHPASSYRQAPTSPRVRVSHRLWICPTICLLACPKCAPEVNTAHDSQSHEHDDLLGHVHYLRGT